MLQEETGLIMAMYRESESILAAENLNAATIAQYPKMEKEDRSRLWRSWHNTMQGIRKWMRRKRALGRSLDGLEVGRISPGASQ